jgi:hypothetical protein
MTSFCSLGMRKRSAGIQTLAKVPDFDGSEVYRKDLHNFVALKDQDLRNVQTVTCDVSFKYRREC